MGLEPATAAIECHQDGHRASLVFNNPRRHNAMSLAMWSGLLQHMKDLAVDDNIRLVVFSGAGDRAFVSGSDISEFKDNRSTTTAAAEYNEIADAAEFAVDEFPKPTIGKIRGYCLGGGLGIALGCDIRICSEDASFSIPAAKLGLGYNYRSVARLIRMLGQAKASELFYSAERFGAEKALELGLVNQVVPSDELDKTVDKLANTITANAPLTLAAFKACANQWKLLDQEGSTDAVNEMVEACYVSDDYKEGQLAFSEKRLPSFRGR